MISLDPHSGVAPFEQIRAQVADLIRAGDLAAGHRLPSIRQLAADLRTAPGTVAKAYAALEEAGLVESSRSRGTRVRPGQALDRQTQGAAQELARAAHRQGLSLEQVLGAVRAAWPH
ncbi:GntR family transcriptional regulator [Pseudactinotalea sp. Z1739]|uniref:GntR family transcriptional regulator n=1 Tax=Pseudactinotalea sp. Z1739 TaxID=3413028 RepID=UPI003C7E97BC